MDNIIRAVFCGSRYATTKSAWLIDHGMVLKLSGVELPEVYEVDFSNSKSEAAKRVLGNADGVVIPDEYFLSKAQQIYAWVYLTSGDSGFTTLQITIPLSQRPDVTDEPPTPQETDLIEQAIAALNDGVDRAETAADNAEQSATEASAAAENIQQTVDDALQEAKDSGEFDGKDGEDGKDGSNGVTYTPTVDAEGVISWVNDGGLPNPQPRNITGPQGDKLTYADLTAADKADLVQGPIAEAQTAAVAAVNQAGAAQEQAVADKGAEVLESIPADYTELSGDVDDLKSAFTVLKLPLIQGGYINANGNFPSSDNFSISDFCPFSVGDKFELFDFNNASWSSYCLGYAFYDSSKTYISGSGSGNFDGHLSSASVTIPQNTAYVRFSTRTQFSPNAYIIISYINGAVNKIERKFAGKQDVIPTIITVGNQTGCDYSSIQSAIDAITDDSQLKPYIIRVLPGTYDLFTLRGVTSVNPRYISIIGTDAINTIIQDNRGNYDYPAAAIQTNGTIENLTFINRTDAEHHTQTQGRTFAYAAHIDYGSIKLKVINCLFICNAGPAVGVGTWQDCELEFNDCKFISECDGTFGDKTNGAFFAHTGLLNDITNQNLTIKNSVAISQYDSTGARFTIISGYTGGSYNYNFQNFGAFGNNGASAAIVDPNSELIGDYSFNNVPNTLNTPNS